MKDAAAAQGGSHLVEPGWTMVLVANPGPGHTISTGAPDSQVRTVTLDDVQTVDFGPRNFAAGFMYTGLDQFGVRWTIDRRKEIGSKSSWVSESGEPAAVIGKYPAGASLETLVGDLEKFRQRMGQEGFPLEANSFREFHSAFGFRRELEALPDMIVEIEKELGELSRRRGELEAYIAHHRWLLGFSDKEQPSQS